MDDADADDDDMMMMTMTVTMMMMMMTMTMMMYCIVFDSNLTEVCSLGSNWQKVTIGSEHGLVHQAITWTNFDFINGVLWHSPESNFTVSVQDTIQFENYTSMN